MNIISAHPEDLGFHSVPDLPDFLGIC